MKPLGTRPAVSARDRRALVLGLTSIAGLIVTFRGVPRLAQWQEERQASARELVQELERAEASIAQARTAHDTLVARDARYLALAPALLPGRTGAASTAALAALVSGAVSGAGAVMGAVQPLADTATGVFRRVGVRVDATGDVGELAKLLEALERGPTLLAVTHLAISQPAPGAPATQSEALRIELEVRGIALGDSSARRP